LFKEIKILHNIATNNGFDEYQALVFSNTYLSAVLARNLRIT
jgi:hypothetical protein